MARRPIHGILAMRSTGSTTSVIRAVFGLALLGGLGWLIYWVTKWVFGIFANVSDNVAAAIVGGVFAILVSSLSVLASRWSEQRHKTWESLREHKVPVYDAFMRFWFQILGNVKRGKSGSTDEDIAKFVSEQMPMLLIWTSDEFLRSFAKFKQSVGTVSGEASVQEKTVWIAHFAQMMLAIRRDLGHKNQGLTAEALLSTFVVDLPSLPGVTGAGLSGRGDRAIEQKGR